MHRSRPTLVTRALTAGVIAVMSASFIGCSSDDAAVTARKSTSTAIAYPTDPDVALLWLGDGYTAPELVIGGDGWVYSPSGQAVDAPPTTTLTVTDNTGTYEHSAYALGYDHEKGNRKDLFDFVNKIVDLAELVGDDNIGPAESYVPATYSVSINGSFYAGEPVDWPDGVSVEEGCIDLPIDRFAPGVAGLYIAVVNGENTRVAVVPDIPGDGCT